MTKKTKAGNSDIKDLIDVAVGKIPPDLILKNGKVINTFTCEIEHVDVAIHSGIIAGLGSYDGPRVIDVAGDYLMPGFIDAHIHLESSMLSPIEFARAVIPLGTTAVMADPHEIANVLGKKGIEFILDTGERIPLDIFILLPSCVPSTDMETSGSVLDCEAIKEFKTRDRVLGLAEVMNFPGVISGSEECLAKLKAFEGDIIDGHSPLLSGKGLNAYILAGPGSDHECTLPEEAVEKLRRGMYIMIREGSQAKNLKTFLPLISPLTARRFLLVTDDLHPDDLQYKGHINNLLDMAIENKIDPLMAIQMVTLNPARYFGLKRKGAIAPGYHADILQVSSLKPVIVRAVFKNGRRIFSEGKINYQFPSIPKSNDLSPMNIAAYNVDSFKIKDIPGKQIRVIDIIKNQIITEAKVLQPKIKDGLLVSDIERDILKIAVVERHKATGNIGLGFISGFGLKKGAIGSSIAHDSHNILAVGTEDKEIFRVVKEIEKMKGGAVAVINDTVVQRLPLPIAGLMSYQPLNDVAAAWERLERGAQEMGCTLIHPFMTLSFMALPVIPKLKITDKGLIDVEEFKKIGLFV